MAVLPNAGSTVFFCITHKVTIVRSVYWEETYQHSQRSNGTYCKPTTPKPTLNALWRQIKKIFCTKLRYNLDIRNIVFTFASLLKRKTTNRFKRRDGRVVDCGGLENRWTERFRGFESLSLREEGRLGSTFFLFTDKNYNYEQGRGKPFKKPRE